MLMKESLQLFHGLSILFKHPGGLKSSDFVDQGSLLSLLSLLSSLSVYLSVYLCIFLSDIHCYFLVNYDLQCRLPPDYYPSFHFAGKTSSQQRFHRCCRFLKNWCLMSGRGIADFNTLIDSISLTVFFFFFFIIFLL